MISNVQVSFRNIGFFLIAIIFWIVLVMYYNSSLNLHSKLIVMAVIVNVLNVVLIFQTYKIPIMLIISIFMYNYSYIFTIPAFYPTKISGVGSYNNNELLLNVLFQVIIGVFALNYLFFVHKPKFMNNRFLGDKLDNFNMKKNTLLRSLGFLGYMFFISLNNSGQQTNLPFSITFEYIFIFIIVFKIYSENTLLYKIIVHIMLLSVCAKTLMYSGRIEVIEALVLLIIFYYEKKIKSIWIIVGSLILNVFMEYMSIMRNTTGDTTWQTSKIFFNRSNPPILVLGNEGDVTQASMAMVGVLQDHLVSSSQRIESFFHMILSQFIPLGNFQAFHDSNVARYIQEFTPTLGGGYIYSQWYFWGGIFGVVVVVFLINQVIKFAYLTKKTTLVTLASIYSLVLFTRWYAYFFDFLIKIPFLLLIIMIIFKLLYPDERETEPKIKVSPWLKNEKKSSLNIK
ncbi:hypothetical protein [Priestia aryabhattai]|uniref:hypothetical protein n=1 Tax=Priestia aryabhattai TaxID=412384 RepID=UPI001C8DD34B|nr:hypothetical protein [Priestia aryabhattai]MBX9987789.1 hypothetical protein [Priestia aryabhattai]